MAKSWFWMLTVSLQERLQISVEFIFSESWDSNFTSIAFWWRKESYIQKPTDPKSFTFSYLQSALEMTCKMTKFKGNVPVV